MKRLVGFLLVAIASAGILLATYPQPSLPGTPLSKFMPAGAMLYLEAKDFHSLLEQWNASPEKARWTSSASYDVFSESRLFLRLSAAGDQFAAAAGVPPDMKFLSDVAGDRSALAVYDIGKLQLLYITHLDSAKSVQNALWQTRSKFEPRTVANVTFYVRRDEQSEREVAFAVSGDYLLLATRADLLAGALQLMATANVRSIESEQWWTQATGAAREPGDLRMVLNLEKIVPDGYFRTYWVQQNITDLSQYSAAVSDLVRNGRVYTEDRVLIRKAEASPTPPEALAAAGELAGIVPDDAGWSQAEATPAPSAAFDMLRTKLLEPHVSAATENLIAPHVQLTGGETGSSADLETRIDEPMVKREAAQGKSALQALIENTKLRASLQVQATSREQSGGVFVRTRTAVALVAETNWNGDQVRSAITALIRPSLTSGELGIAWSAKPGYLELDGLLPLLIAVRDNRLVLANDPALMQALLTNMDRKVSAQPAQYVAVFHHAREQENFQRLSDVVDRPAAHNDGESNAPQFFSGTIGGLSGSLSRVARETIIVRPDGGKVRQTVTYEWLE